VGDDRAPARPPPRPVAHLSHSPHPSPSPPRPVILSGVGEAFCDALDGRGVRRWPLRAGDAVVFRPGCVHGIDVPATTVTTDGAATAAAGAGGGKLCALELMVPNDRFAELVRAGGELGAMSAEDLCLLIAVGCGGGGSGGGSGGRGEEDDGGGGLGGEGEGAGVAR